VEIPRYKENAQINWKNEKKWVTCACSLAAAAMVNGLPYINKLQTKY
jgi:hypothetical protein